MATELYRQDDHMVLVFSDLVHGDGIQSNQLLIKNNKHSAIFDPGGDLTYMPLNIALRRYESIKELDYVIATHQDPDIISALDKWLMYSDAKIIISELWSRFIPHLVPNYLKSKEQGRIISIPDSGAIIPLGDTSIIALPAHFLHSVGNFHFYDPISKILFSGDVGASMVESDAHMQVEDFEQHKSCMLEFHQRFMCSNRACRLWVNMVRQLDIEMLVPQHGRPFFGKGIIEKFLNWFETLQCGIDKLEQRHYVLPTEQLFSNLQASQPSENKALKKTG